MDAILVITNLPDQQTALDLAHKLVSERIAACVNVLGPCQSIYRWQGAIETATEYPLLIKSTATCYPRIQQMIQENHPYELPEIIAIPINQGLPAYLNWIGQETLNSSL